ncbi:unnamed protein product [Mytilus edulis]|uniref:Uncharacterized protein n=1 Tax=Mytilus edulis TaxID=6550 RepID=A0A8S3TMR5_MYTED|nr:unnamed protein product [Mytilus edulis]
MLIKSTKELNISDFQMANEMSDDERDNVVQDNTKDKTRDPLWKWKLNLIKDIRESVGTVESGKNILNVAVIGNKGCGKSSFINTLLTSLRKDKWQLYAQVGMNNGNISSITRHLKRENQRERKDYRPLEEHTTNPDDFKNKIFKRTEYLKINRIIVVTTSDPAAPIPTELFKCINEVATDLKGIPIFGVMTKKDQFEDNEEIPQRTLDFLASLGITKESFCG